MKNAFLLLILVIFSACGSSDNSCKTQESCLTDSKCQCWCSMKCGFRDKKPTDKPVWIANDSNENSCYCNQWDYDNYVNNCVENKGIKEQKK